MIRIRILNSALEDLDAGREFYARQGPGLGDYFLDSLFSDIDSLLLYRGLHRMKFGYHRLLSRRFPYAIYYKMHADESVVVHRVLDMRQHPERIRNALT